MRRQRSHPCLAERTEAARGGEGGIGGAAPAGEERVGARDGEVEVLDLRRLVPDEDVVRAQRNRVVPEQVLAQLLGDGQRIAIGAEVDALGGERRDDEAVGAQLASHPVRHVLGETAIDERHAVDFDGLEDEWDGEGGTHGAGEIASGEGDRLASAQVGGDSAEADRQ